MSVESFNRLVKLVARAFYDDITTTTRGDKQLKTGRSDNRGIAVVVLDALTRRQWVREEDLAKDLKLHSKQLRRTLRFFEEEKLITRHHRKETSKGAKFFSAAVAATQQSGREGEEKIKLHTHSYCCLDYAQICDVVRYRLHRMKKMLKDGLENRNTVQEYICPNCSRRYNALDALRLISLEDDCFHCENCNGELVAESDKLATQEMGDGDDNAKRCRREKLREMFQNMEAQLKALTVQLNRVKDLPVPEFGTLSAWEVRVNKVGRGIDDPTSNVLNKTTPGIDGPPMPFVGEPKIEVAILDVEGKSDVKSEIADEPMKKLPPWMITQRMNLTKEQRGEVKQESNMESTSVFGDDNKSSDLKDDHAKNIQNAYYTAYYTAILKRQQEQDAAAFVKQEETGDNSSLDPQVGMKRKHADNDDDDDIDWEEAPPAGYNTNESYNVSVELNAEANADVDAAVDEEDEEIDWEEG